MFRKKWYLVKLRTRTPSVGGTRYIDGERQVNALARSRGAAVQAATAGFEGTKNGSVLGGHAERVSND